MRSRLLGVIFACSLVLGVSASAASAPTFTFPVRIGFEAGDDWEPAIATDRYGHVYALWSHYVGFGGCRLEDLVRVTAEGCERLTDYPYDLAP